MNTIVLRFGAMYGVSGANMAIKSKAKAFAQNVPKQIMRMALTKGALYPFVKTVL